jgi:hypothetical protein
VFATQAFANTVSAAPGHPGCGASIYRFTASIAGRLHEHDERLGMLTFGTHPDVAFLRELIVDVTPFREQRMTQGWQCPDKPLLHVPRQVRR